MKTAIVGGGAAGFFLAVNLKAMVPAMQVDIFERSQHVLAKVEVSGGGRCNCTNSFAAVTDLSHVYPRGHRLLKRLFKQFDHLDAFRWFEAHGVTLTTQPDHCVFPASQDAHSIINCFLAEARRTGIAIHTGCRIGALADLANYDFVAITTGGSPKADGLEWLRLAGHEVEAPVPSLFSLKTDSTALQALMGTVVEVAAVRIPGTNFAAQGPLLVTHWGLSGPAALKLSSHAARFLADCNYACPLSINWTGADDAHCRTALQAIADEFPQRLTGSVRPFDLPQRLWHHLLERALGPQVQKRWGEVGKKDVNRLVNVLCNDTYALCGRAPFKDEFVTCGGISLKSIQPNTLESRAVPNLFFAGEVLDIDGVTGGFNFQAAWTTAYVVASAIAQQAQQ